MQGTLVDQAEGEKKVSGLDQLGKDQHGDDNDPPLWVCTWVHTRGTRGSRDAQVPLLPQRDEWMITMLLPPLLLPCFLAVRTWHVRL